MSSTFEQVDSGDYMDKDVALDKGQGQILLTEMKEDLDGVSNYFTTAYNNTMSYLQSELDDLGMSDHQKAGIFFIFVLSSLLLVGSMMFLCCCGRRALCRRIREEDRFIVYRRMVEFDHIISVEEDAKCKSKQQQSNKGKLSA